MSSIIGVDLHVADVCYAPPPVVTKSRKSSATIMVGDGRGSMRPVDDHRFADGDWPIKRGLPDSEATSWMAHMRAEAQERNWPTAALGQLDPNENSGSCTIRVGQESDAPVIEVAWEKPRRGSLVLHARAGDPARATDAQAFIDAVDARHRERRLHREHRRSWLRYEGLPWEGELWLAPEIRIGPPSRRPPTLIGPQVLVIDAMVAGIGQQGVTDEFRRLLRELQLVMRPILQIQFEQLERHANQDWVPDVNEQGQVTDCRVRWIGYVELEQVIGMPVPGAIGATGLEQVRRPDLGLSAIRLGIDLAVRPPSDVIALWKAFSESPAGLQKQFLQACNCYATAQMMWPTQRTAYATFLVVACEALKPTGRRYHNANFYDVVNSFVGSEVVGRLQNLRLNPQRVRSDHVHRAQLVADELVPRLFSDDFHDPSLDVTLIELTTVVRACLIEWLRCRGDYQLKWAPRPKNDKHARGSRRAPRGKAKRSRVRSKR
jgi:hypothetical protein